MNENKSKKGFILKVHVFHQTVQGKSSLYIQYVHGRVRLRKIHKVNMSESDMTQEHALLVPMTRVCKGDREVNLSM